MEGIVGKERRIYRVVEFSILTKGCNESARKEMIGLKIAKTPSGFSMLGEREGVKPWEQPRGGKTARAGCSC